jgi:succinyl-CoA synthetase beta subunit
MKLQEYHAKALLREQGLPVPDYTVAESVAAARAAADRYLETSGRVVVKAQVLVGGRGKAGGVKLAGSADEAERVAADILGMDITGITVRRVLVAPAADIEREYYLACVLDRAARRVLLMGSAEGGVEIEQVAASKPEAISHVHAHPHLGLLDYQARLLAFEMGLGAFLREFVAICRGLYATMTAHDADLVEINPLAIVRVDDQPPGQPGRRLECLDAKITIDDSALPRHPALEQMRDLDEEDPVDRAAREQGLSFIRLEGSIGCMVNGAGLAMTTMDLIKRAGGEAANFLDIGGGAKADRVAAAMRLILSDPHVRAILVNIFGGIARGDEVAHGLVEARGQQERHVPMVVRIVGTNADEAARILDAAGDPDIQTAATLDEAVEQAVAAAAAAPAAEVSAPA